MRAKVILYRLGEDSETGRALREVLREQKLLTLSAAEDQLTETVGRLVSTNCARPSTPLPLPDRVPETGFLLLCDLGERQLDRLLAAMRRAGVHVPHKAVLTPFNRDWTLCKLIEEVSREHASMTGTE
ncbi:MAG: DUF3783 domain-containing protein [Ruminococcaceae bacterium]|jgi:hypothetical protein|nr:DUF3783 domain-containing protein [Oscillospiraceae bacterium]